MNFFHIFVIIVTFFISISQQRPTPSTEDFHEYSDMDLEYYDTKDVHEYCKFSIKEDPTFFPSKYVEAECKPEENIRPALLDCNRKCELVRLPVASISVESYKVERRTINVTCRLVKKDGEQSGPGPDNKSKR